jgi:carboxypeptidase C (cathepsin A)
MKQSFFGCALLLLGCGHHESPSATAPGDGGPRAAPSPVPRLVAESGFFDVPAQPTAVRSPARLFYVFHPADDAPAEKPLALFFNGGPGMATSQGLLAYGTAPFTLNADDSDAGAVPAPNPASWTSFANLLYVDMRASGFSYGLGGAAAAEDGGGLDPFSPAEDAADFVRALLSFYSGHPQLEANPVIVVGESYGGVRAQ